MILTVGVCSANSVFANESDGKYEIKGSFKLKAKGKKRKTAPKNILLKNSSNNFTDLRGQLNSGSSTLVLSTAQNVEATTEEDFQVKFTDIDFFINALDKFFLSIREWLPLDKIYQ